MKLIKNVNYCNLDDGSEDGLDVIDTEYQYFDNDLNLAGWVTKRVTDTSNFIGFIDFTIDQKFGKLRLCKNCLKHGFEVLLGVKMLKECEKPEQFEEQLQCHECATVYPLHLKQHQSSKKKQKRKNNNTKRVTIF